jgi:hypothetical protein
MGQEIEINQGEIKVKFNSPTEGKLSFKDLGITDEQLVIDSGFLRLQFDMEGIGEHDYFQVPTIEVSYKENCAETHWQCDFNKEIILDKMDHHGHATVLLLDRKKISALEHHHENRLTVHAEFPEKVHLIAEDSYINLFK